MSSLRFAATLSFLVAFTMAGNVSGFLSLEENIQDLIPEYNEDASLEDKLALIYKKMLMFIAEAKVLHDEVVQKLNQISPKYYAIFKNRLDSDMKTLQELSVGRPIPARELPISSYRQVAIAVNELSDAYSVVASFQSMLSFIDRQT